MDTLGFIFEQLPDKDLQARRAGRRRVFPCPSCGENVFGCSSVRTSPKKPFDQMGIRIPCPKCGDFTIDVSVRKGKEIWTVVETGKRYDRFSRVRASGKRLVKLADSLDNTKEEDCLVMLETASKDAEELRLADPDNEDLHYPYMMAVNSYNRLITMGRTDLVEDLARFTLKCNDISQYDLLFELRTSYRLIDEHQDMLPRALYIKAMIERTLVDEAFDFAEDAMAGEASEDSMIERIELLVKEFDSLPAKEKASCPYAAADGRKYILNTYSRNGGRGVAPAAKKVIAAIRKARKSGAPEDRLQLMRMATCYRRMAPYGRKKYDEMLADAELWSDPLFLAMADFMFAERVRDVMLGDYHVDMDRVSPEDREEALRRIEEAIGILETRDDVDEIASIVTESYNIRGFLRNDMDDYKLSCLYGAYFCNLGLIDARDLVKTMMDIIVTSGDPQGFRDWAEEHLGFSI